MFKDFKRGFSGLGNRGFSLIQVLIIGGTLVGTVTYFSQQVWQTKKFVQHKMRKETKYTDSLKGGMVFANYILKERKCIDLSTGIEKKNCIGITDSGNLERLLISDATDNEFKNKYRYNGGELESFYNAGNSKIGLRKMSFNIKKSNITPGHPLYTMMRSGGFGLRGDRLQVEYVSEPNSHGNDILVKINLNLYKKTEILGKAYSEVIFFPRQINQNVLSLNKNLLIGSSINPTKDDNQLSSTKSGIIFYSPVFVNGDIVIPGTSNSPSDEKILLKDRVYMTGDLKTHSSKNVKMFTPSTPGGKNTTFQSRYEGFKGLKGGIYRVAYEDALTSLFAYNSKPVSTVNMNKCIDYQNRKYDASKTRDSRLIIKKRGTNKYLMGLTKLNEFTDVIHTYKDEDYLEYRNDGGAKNVSNFHISVNWKKRTNEKGISIYPISFSLGKNRTAIFDIDAAGAVVPMDTDWIKDDLKSTKTKLVYTRTLYGKKDGKTVEKIFDTKTLSASTKTKLISEKDDGTTKDLEEDKTDKEVSKTVDSKTINTTLVIYESCTLNEESGKYDCKKIKRIYPPSEKINRKIEEFNSRPTIEISLKEGVGASQLKLDIVFKNNDVNDTYPDTNWYFTPNFELSAHSFLTDGITGADVISDGGPKFFHHKMDFEFKGGYQVKKNYSTISWNTLDNKSISLDDEEIEVLSSNPPDFYTMCSDVETSGSGSTGGGSSSTYNADYSESSFTSWNYRPIDGENQFVPAPTKTDYNAPYGHVFNSSDAKVKNKLIIDGNNHDNFHTYGVLDRCIINSTANHVMGFLICRYLKIKKRTGKLTMIGSFIVDKLEIEGSDNDIVWMNIFHSSARTYLDKTGEINTLSNCKINKSSPLWNPTSAAEMDRMRKCTPAYLMERAEPFKWTSFNPLCGMKDSDSIMTTCKPSGRALNYYFLILNENYEL
ncbi:MAG: hypothetical protein KAQ98_09630 [Bacteriovoracaceae bacterium]|nr:hypothetical protein [Bacteriovoracaceae bacterium]